MAPAETAAATAARRCRCGLVFQAPVVRAAGRDLGPRSCSDCRAKARRHESEAAGQDRAATDRAGRIVELLAQSGDVNPWKHGRATLENYRPSAGGGAIGGARSFVDEVLNPRDRWAPIQGLYLCGPTGTGKTHLAAGIARELLLDPSFPPNGVVFDHSLMLIGRIQDCYSTGASVEAVIRPRIDARVWILDDLGTEQPSEDVVRRLTAIFTLRECRPNVVTSNLTVDELCDRSSGLFRVQSRLGPQNFRHFRLEGQDARYRANGSSP